jgi:hypothetical protein
MSVKVMGMVWETSLPPNQKLVLLAYADHADHDGNNVFPAVGRIAMKTGYSERQVQRVTAKLVEAGWLISDGDGPKGTNRYSIPMDRLPDAPADMAGDRLSPGRGDRLTPQGDRLSGSGVTSATGGGDMSSGSGVTPMSPDPSLDPSINHPMKKNGVTVADELGLNNQKVQQVQDFCHKWLRKIGKGMPSEDAKAYELYLTPAAMLLDRYEWDMDAAFKVAMTVRGQMLDNGKTPYYLAAIVPKVFAALDSISQEQRWNTT